MGPKGKHPATGDLFQQPLSDLINLKHPLVKLAELIDWSVFETRWAAFFPSRTLLPPRETLQTKLHQSIELARLKLKSGAEGFDENHIVGRQGGTIAGNTSKEIEEKTGKPVVTKQNAKKLK